MDQAYSRLWKQLMHEGKALYSTALSAELTELQKTIIRQYTSGTVLDLGAGDLAYKTLLTPQARRYFSLDIEKIDSRLDCIANGETLPFPENCFDTVFSSQVMEHTPHPAQMMTETARVLKSGGHLLLFVPFMFYLHGEPHDYHRFTPHSLKQYAVENGFEVVEQGHVGGLLAFMGMLVQNVWLLLTYQIPLIKTLSWQVNRFFNWIITVVDRRFGMRHKFPIVIYIVALKK